MSETVDQPPGPSGLPLIGSTFSVVRDHLGFGERCKQEYGDVAATRVAGDRYYQFAHPDDVQTILVDRNDAFEKGEMVRDRFQTLAPAALVVSESAAWQRRREAIQPGFFRERVDAYADPMLEDAQRAVDDWLATDTVDLLPTLRDMSLRVLVRTLFGLDPDAADGERVTAAAGAINDKFDSSNPSIFLPDWVPTPTNRRFRRAVADLDTLVDDLIAARERDGPAGEDLLSMPVVARQATVGLDDDELRDNLEGLLLAGHDTTATAIGFAVSLLTNNPEVQDRLRECLPSEGPITPSTVRESDYLDWVVDESLRLYPVAPALFREPTEPVDVGGYTVPEGVVVSVSPWVTHHDERWFADPWTFRPERFRPERAADRPEYAHFPFGGGPRHCIGMRFATLEIKLTLATLLGRAVVEPVTTDIGVSGGITLTPTHPLEVRVRNP